MHKLTTSLRKVGPWKSIMIHAGFSDTPQGSSQYKVYEDWQYRQMIASQLKDSNCTQAVSLVFQSYLNNKVLDIQIYSQLFNKLHASELPPSYPEMLYLIYHEHFPPHALIKKWMHKLTFSKNQDLIQKLRVDYGKMGEPYPLRKSLKRQLRQQKKEPEEPEIQQSSVQQQQQKKPKVSPVELLKKYMELHNIQVGNDFDGKLQPEELFRIKLIANMKGILSQLNITTSEHTDINIDGLSVEFLRPNQDEVAEAPQLPSDQQYQFQGMMPNHLQNLFGVDINKIKIKRLEIHPKYNPF